MLIKIIIEISVTIRNATYILKKGKTNGLNWRSEKCLKGNALWTINKDAKIFFL